MFEYRIQMNKNGIQNRVFKYERALRTPGSTLTFYHGETEMQERQADSLKVIADSDWGLSS